MDCTQGQGQSKGEGQGQGVLSAPSKPKLRRGLWSPEEDEKLITFMTKRRILGSSWTSVAKRAGLQRCGKSCRLRWINYLRPDLKRGPFSPREEQLIIHLQSIIGNSWSQIAASLPGRSDNEIKNYWNSFIKKNRLKHKLPFSSADGSSKTDTDTKFNLTSDNNSVSAPSRAHDVCTSFPPAELWDVMGEGYQQFNRTFSVVTTTQNQFCAADVLEFRHENPEFSIVGDPSNNQLISYSQLSIDSTPILNQESFSTHAYVSRTLQEQDCKEIEAWTSALAYLPREAEAEAGSVCYSTCEIFNETQSEIMSGCLSFPSSSGISSAWNPRHQYSIGTDYCAPGDYISNLRGISSLEDYKSLHENTSHQACPSPNFRSNFSGSAIISADVHQYCNDQAQAQAQAQDDCEDRVNLGYDEVHLGDISTYIHFDMQKISYQFSHIGEVQLSYQQDCSIIPDDGLLEFQCEGETDKATVCSQYDDPVYNIVADITACSYPASQTYFHF